jgi:hypothetical protein
MVRVGRFSTCRVLGERHAVLIKSTTQKGTRKEHMKKINLIARAGAAVVIALLMCPILAVCETHQVQGGAGIGGVVPKIRIDSFTLTPGVELMGVYDSNVAFADDKVNDDFSVILKPSLWVSRKSATVETEASLWGSFEQYARLTELNHTDFGESLFVGLWNRNSVLVKINESFGSYHEPGWAPDEIVDIRLTKAGVSAGKDMTDKLQLDTAYNFNSTDYQFPGLYNWYQNAVQAEIAHAITPKSSAILTGNAGTQNSEGSDSTANFESVLMGAKTRLTRKVQGKIGFGWYGHNSSVNSISMVGYDAELTWRATPKIDVRALADNAVEPARDQRDNYDIISQMHLSCTWRFNDRFSGTVSASFIQDEYDQKVVIGDSEVKERDYRTVGRIRLTYAPPARFLTAFAEQGYQARSSNLADSGYDEVMTTIGLAITY